MNVLEGLWSAYARSSPVSSPPGQSPLESPGAGSPAEGIPPLAPSTIASQASFPSQPPTPPDICNRNRNRKEEINMHSQRKEIGSLSAYRVLDAREIRELNSEGFDLRA